MDFVKQVWVGQEGAEAGLRAEIDCPPLVFNPWKVGRIGIAKDAPAKGDKLFMHFAR